MRLRPLRDRRGRRPTGARAEAGVTLVELLVVMMLMLVVMAAVYGVWSRLAGAYLFTEDDIRAQAESRQALGELVEYIRTARVPEMVADQALDTPIPVATPFEIWIWTDIDRDPAHDLELVRFMLRRTGDSTVLFSQLSLAGDGVWDGSTVRVIDQNVRNGGDGAALDPTTHPLFVYHDANGVELTGAFDVTRIRTIGINLRVDIDIDRAPVVHELSSVVQPRNARQ